MNAHTDIYLTHSDASQATLFGDVTLHHECELGNTSPDDNFVQDNLSLLSPNPSRSDIEAYEERAPMHPSKSDGEPSSIQTEGNMPIHECRCTFPGDDSNQDIIPAVTKEASQSERAIVPPAGNNEAITTLYPLELPLLCTRTVSADEPLRDKREADQNCCLTSARMPDQVQNAVITSTMDEVEAREDLGYPSEDLPSLPPSSSPPQLFSSSPLASSQSSGNDVESSKMVPGIGVEQRASPFDHAHDNHVPSAVQGNSGPESGYLDGHDTTEVATLPSLQTSLASRLESDLGSPRKRSIDHDDESPDSKFIKHSKLDSRLYLPPATKRTTVASQNRQFQKLASPFRPPLKDGPANITNNKVESTDSTALGAGYEKVRQKGSTIAFQRKGPNTPRSLTQFKSPLVNRDLPADSCTIRLTPALQTLERKLQLLKRAIKVKEENEEEVLGRLAEKWIEAGREAAYDVWDATRDASDSTGKGTFICRSYGLESANDGNTPWGWDTKSGDGDGESCSLGTSDESCKMGRQVSEEDGDIGRHTLGTMLRQLGIDPDIFGWDDEKETFSD